MYDDAKKFAPALPRASARRWRSQQRGFTFVELCLGMIVTTFIASALGAFALAMGNCWRRASSVQSTAMVANQLSLRVQSRVLDAKRIGYWRAGSNSHPAGFIYWRDDTNDDLAMNYGEFSVMAFDPANKAIVVYTPTTVDDDMGDEWATDEFNDNGAIERLETGLTGVPLIQNVSNATLTIDQATSATMNPTVTWTVQLTQADGSMEQETVSATLRAPATPAQ